MINKFFPTPEAALADVPDGATIMIGGFGNAGMPARLIDCLIAQGAKDLTVVNNNAGNADTGLAEGKETRHIDGRDYVLEYPIHADYALIKADRADRWGNLSYRKTARNFGPIMAAAAKCTVVQVRETVELGELDPELVVTPGIFVKRVVKLH